MRRRPTDPASRGLRLFVLVVIFGVALPSLLLTGFGLIAIGNERAAASQRLREMYTPLCRRLAARVSQALEQRAQVLRERLPLLLRWARREIPAPAEVADLESIGVIALVAFGEDGRRLLPRAERPVPTWQGFLPPEYEEGLRLEFAERDAAAAAQRYRAALAPYTPGPGRCPILSALARALWKAGDTAAAVATLEEATQRCADFVDPTGYHAGLGNLLFALEIAATPEQRARAAGALTRRLSQPLLVVAPGQARMTIRRAIAALGPAPEDDLRQVRSWLERLSSRERLAQALWQRPPPAAAAGFSSLLVEGTPRLLWIDDSGRTAAEWLPEAVEREILLPALAAEDAGAPLTLRLVHATATSADGGADPTSSAALSKDLRDWRVELRLADSGALDDLARSRTRLYLWALLLLVLVLAFGICWLVLITVREARLTRLKTDFVSSVSHELRTPLTSIRMFVDTLLLERTRDEAERREALTIIGAESERLTRLVERILDFARMEAGRRAYRFEPQSPRELVAAALDACRPLIEGQGFAVRQDIPADLPEIPADRDAIIEVLINLITNAIKYSPENRRVEVAARREGDAVLVSVRDFGIGIPGAEHGRIFEKFYRVDHPVTAAVGGSGLGLSLVRYIVSAHGGRITVESAPGQGSTFTVRLPLSRGEA